MYGNGAGTLKVVERAERLIRVGLVREVFEYYRVGVGQLRLQTTESFVLQTPTVTMDHQLDSETLDLGLPAVQSRKVVLIRIMQPLNS
jgi:hypothetical protein